MMRMAVMGMVVAGLAGWARAAAPTSEPAPGAVVQVKGAVLDGGAIREGIYRLDLTGEGRSYEQRNRADGTYGFAGVAPGTYELTCAPVEGAVPLVVVAKVVVARGAAPVAIDIPLGGKFAVSGKVTLADGSPAAGWTVRATFRSADGNVEMSTAGKTGADGAYRVTGPFEEVAFVGVISSPEPAPVKEIKAPRTGVNFRLTSEQEEQRRVR